MSRLEKGQTLMELVVVVSVSAIVIGALVFATISSLRNAQLAKYQAQATKLAQEGIEKVRSARDQNASFSGFRLGSNTITNWQDPNFWTQINNGSCGNDTLTPPQSCYFAFSSASSLTLTALAVSTSIPSGAEDPFSGDPVNAGKFKRVVVISDDSSFAIQKIVTVIVVWSDYSGSHQSKLTTILRKT